LSLEEIFEGRDVAFFGYARTALEYGYRYLGLKAGDEVLYPDLICDVAMVPCRRLGLNVGFYRINDSLETDIADLERQVTGSTRAILAVHYFGFPQRRLDSLKGLCRRRGLYLIEDNAHSFLSSPGGRFLGFTGDISIYSFRKTVPVVNGAALLVNRHFNGGDDTWDVKLAGEMLPPEKRIRRIRGRLKLFEAKYRVPLSRLRRTGLHVLPHGATEYETLDYKADEWSMSVLRDYPYAREITRRRDNFRRWVDRLTPLGLVPVKELESGTVPMCCPMYSSERDRWLERYLGKGYRVSPWPTLPREVSRKGGGAVDIWKRLITFPV